MHVHFSGIEGIKVALYVIVILGTLNLLALKFKDRSSLAASYANLFGLI
jgi:hypothetical protein